MRLPRPFWFGALPIAAGLLAAGAGVAPRMMQPSSPAAVAPEPDREDIAASVKRFLTEKPFLRLRVRTITDDGKELFCICQMGRDRYRLELSAPGDPRVTFAQYRRGARIQEYAPSVMFATGNDASEVVVQFDAVAGWNTKLLPFARACQIGILLSSWVEEGRTEVPIMMSEIVAASTSVDSGTVNDRPSYIFHATSGDTAHELSIDRETYQPLRWVRSQTTEKRGQTVILTRQNDFEIERFDTDANWRWELDADHFRPATPPQPEADGSGPASGVGDLEPGGHTGRVGSPVDVTP